MQAFFSQFQDLIEHRLQDLDRVQVQLQFHHVGLVAWSFVFPNHALQRLGLPLVEQNQCDHISLEWLVNCGGLYSL